MCATGRNFFLINFIINLYHFQGFRYAAHSFILRARCRYFSDFWNSLVTQQSDDAKLQILFTDNSISSETFRAMLYYIYSGEYDKSLCHSDGQSLNAILQRF